MKLDFAKFRGALWGLAFLLESLVAGCALLDRPEALEPSVRSTMAHALEPWISSGELPGAISILYDEGRTEVATMGYADVEQRRPISLDDVFMQCSQTKGFCGVTVAKLVEEGRLDLDDPVEKYLPEFKTLWIEAAPSNGVRRLVKAQQTLTVRMCLNHTGGFPFEIPAKQPSIPRGGWTGGMPIRSVAATAAAQPLLFEPGTRVQYSNTGLDIAAAIVETIIGKPWQDYVQEVILDPLEMHDTSFWPTDRQLRTKIELYRCVENLPAEHRLYEPWQQPPYNDDHVFASAGGGLWTTARDQFKFYKMLMNLGLTDTGTRILEEETVKHLLAVSTRPTNLGGYSLGFNAPLPSADDSTAWFGHGGAWGTEALVNWHRHQINLWVVQLVGMPRPWNTARNRAADAFFHSRVNREGVDAYTGRTE